MATEISNGRQTVKLYCWVNRGKAMYQLAYYMGGKRVQKNFADKSEAKRVPPTQKRLFQSWSYRSPKGDLSPYVGAKLAYAASQAFTQKRSQRCTIKVTNFAGDSLDVAFTALNKGFCALDPQILKIAQGRFAKDLVATSLQGARACGESLSSFTQRESGLKMFS
jgi:hypothetical protein